MRGPKARSPPTAEGGPHASKAVVSAPYRTGSGSGSARAGSRRESRPSENAGEAAWGCSVHACGAKAYPGPAQGCHCSHSTENACWGAPSCAACTGGVGTGSPSEDVGQDSLSPIGKSQIGRLWTGFGQDLRVVTTRPSRSHASRPGEAWKRYPRGARRLERCDTANK